MSQTPQDIHNEYLGQLRAERAEAKQLFDVQMARLKKLDAAIAALEGLDNPDPVPSAPGIVVGADQYRNVSTPKALSQIMVANPHRYKARELAEALTRSGQSKEIAKALQNTKFYLNRWRGDEYADYQDSDHTWGLTAKGRTLFSSGQRQPSEQSLFAGRK